MFGPLLLNPPMAETPLLGLGLALGSGWNQSRGLPLTMTSSVCPSFRFPGSTVVTLMLNGEYFSATKAQICWIAVRSDALKFDVFPSQSNGGTGVLLSPD